VIQNNDQTAFKWESKYSSLRKWRFNSFKSVAYPVEIELAPLTIVVGANSSGKSTLIQSILLMAQNAMRFDERSTAKSQGIFELNGPLVQLGTFEETHCDLIKEKKLLIEFGGTWFSSDKLVSTRASGDTGTGITRVGEQFINWRLSIRPIDRSIDSGIAVVNDSNVEYFRKGAKEQEHIAKSSSSKKDELIKSKYENFSFAHLASISDYRKNSKDDDTRPLLRLNAVSFQAGLPTNGLIRKNIVEYLFDNQQQVIAEAMEMGPSIDPELSESEIAENRYKGYPPFIDDYVIQLAEYGKRIVQQDRIAEDRDVNSLSRIVEQFPVIPFEKFPEIAMQFFGVENDPTTEVSIVEKNFHWQMFRDLRKRFDELFGDAEWTKETTLCGSNGSRIVNPRSGLGPGDSPLSNVIRYWNRYLSEKILYLGPLRVGPRASYGIGSSVENYNLPLGESGEFLAKKLFTDKTIRAYPVVENGQLRDSRMTLEEAVSYWYQELSSTNEVDNINVEAPNRQGYPLKLGKRTLANVGFGASQILPVLGLCLSASPGELILLEQPELHLNPGMQQKLADFLLIMSKTGRQVIVETHSEYLITRLRRNAASSQEDHKYFTIIFVERDSEAGTTYRTVNVDDRGDLSEWPKGFFDHVAEDLRVLMRKAAERQSGKTEQ